jgi:transcriptional regulator with XRE-family HTH domain
MPPRKSADMITPEELLALAEAMGCRTQQDLAERLGVTQPRVSQILSGTYPLKPGPLLNLVRELQARYADGRRQGP